jgi:hypothetical protein
MTTAVTMYVAPGTHIASSPQSGRLNEDPAKPTPTLKSVTVFGGATSDHGTYSTSLCTAICNITSAEYTNLYSLLYSAPHQVEVNLCYDETAPGTNKPITSGPTFTGI